MPLTKAEFDKWRAQADEADVAMNKLPGIIPACIGRTGVLHIKADCISPESTRALYEMLRAWYGESVMTEKAKAVIEAAVEWMTIDSSTRLPGAVSAYRAEQKQ